MNRVVPSPVSLSKVLFNAQHRLAVSAVFLVGPKLLGYEEVASRAGVSRSVAHKELGVLVHVGALGRLEAGRVVLYQRLESAYWPFAVEMLARAQSER